ncbi:MAG: cyclic nucleotide-binding domain-containing protein [Gammaproteobacteria bacterium]|nr:cyclic nucleotide-binding domain-containing protein [Gammaproteobacteria bacterium]
MIENSLEIQGLQETISRVVELEENVLLAFLGLFQIKVIEKGKSFVTEGEVGDEIAYVTSGLLRSYYISPKGEEFNKHFFLNGSFVAPLTSLVMNIPSPVYIGALEKSKLLVAKYDELSALYNQYPTLNILGRKLVEYAWVGKRTA